MKASQEKPTENSANSGIFSTKRTVDLFFFRQANKKRMICLFFDVLH